MSRKKKAMRAFLFQNPEATRTECWDAAWANEQSRVSSLKHQELEAENKALRLFAESMKARYSLSPWIIREADAALQPPKEARTKIPDGVTTVRNAVTGETISIPKESSSDG